MILPGSTAGIGRVAQRQVVGALRVSTWLIVGLNVMWVNTSRSRKTRLLVPSAPNREAVGPPGLFGQLEDWLLAAVGFFVGGF